MPGLRERIAEALWPGGPVPQIHNRPMAERVADAVMVEVQRDLDELEARVERKMARLRQAGEVIDAAEADAARLAEALEWACPVSYDRRPERVATAFAAHRERENQTSFPVGPIPEDTDARS